MGGDKHGKLHFKDDFKKRYSKRTTSISLEGKVMVDDTYDNSSVTIFVNNTINENDENIESQWDNIQIIILILIILISIVIFIKKKKNNK